MPDIVKLLDHPEFSVKNSAQTILTKLGPLASPVAPLLLQRLQAGSSSVRLQAIEILWKIAPEESRSDIGPLARNDTDFNVRAAALPAIGKPSELAEIIRKDPSENVKKAALKLLSDQQELAALLKNDWDPGFKDAILNRISDRATLLELIAAGPSVLRLEALQKLPSFVVAEIASRNADPMVRRDAVWVVADSAILTRIAESDTHAEVREAAKISALGKRTDLKVGGMDCKITQQYGPIQCIVQIINEGAVAYTNIKYLVGDTYYAGMDAQGETKRLNATIEPGETREFDISYTSLSFGNAKVQFRLMGLLKAAPAKKQN